MSNCLRTSRLFLREIFKPRYFLGENTKPTILFWWSFPPQLHKKNKDKMGIFLLFSSYQKRGGNRVRHEPENEKEEKKERKTFSCLTGFWKGKIQFGAFFWPCELNSSDFTEGGKEREGCRNKKMSFSKCPKWCLVLEAKGNDLIFCFVLRCMRVVLGVVVPVIVKCILDALILNLGSIMISSSENCQFRLSWL